MFSIACRASTDFYRHKEQDELIRDRVEHITYRQQLFSLARSFFCSLTLLSETIFFIIINNDTRIIKSNEVVNSSSMIIFVFVDLCNQVSQVDVSVIILIDACGLNNEEK